MTINLDSGRESPFDTMDSLEAESVFIMREAVAQLERPVLLFSGGKDRRRHDRGRVVRVLRTGSDAGRQPSTPEPAAGHPYPWYAAVPWHGMPWGIWVALLRRHGFRVSLRRFLAVGATVTAVAPINSFGARLQNLVYGRRIAGTVVPDPIFVIGHWRSGTTMLHELLVLDERFGYPRTTQCFCPASFMFVGWLLERFGFLMPKQRPMDAMPVSWTLPQEDEFALCNLGLPSPYLAIAFPNDGPSDPDDLDLERISPAARERWQRTLFRFLQAVTSRDGRRLVLKSPPHTARVRTLVDLFPAARFVHIVRDPRAVFPSTVRLWTSLYRDFSLQDPHYRGLEEHVLGTFEQMYAAFERQRSMLGPASLVELRYEDLVRDPIHEMKRVYEALELGGFEAVAPRIREYFEQRRAYRPHTYAPDPARDAVLAQRWGGHARRYGYELPSAADPG